MIGVQVGVAASALAVRCTVPFVRPTHTMFESVFTFEIELMFTGEVFKMRLKLIPPLVLRKSWGPGLNPRRVAVTTKTLQLTDPQLLFGSMAYRHASVFAGRPASP